MPAEICQRCNAVEECYAFMLAYAAQGVSSSGGTRSDGTIRDVLQQAVNALSGLADACMAAEAVLMAVIARPAQRPKSPEIV